MDYGYSEKRRKGKHKMKDRKKHPYRMGGAQRTMSFKREEGK